MKKKMISLMLTTAMVVATLAGCGNEASTSKENEDKVTEDNVTKENGENATDDGDEIIQLTFTWQDGDGDFDEDGTWPTETFLDLNEYLRETYGVELVMNGVSTEELDLMLASDTYLGDIIKVSSDYTSRLIETGQVVNMDDYADLVPNVIGLSETRENAVRSFASNDTGDFCWWTPAVGIQTAGKSVWNGYTIRWDYYKELGYPEVTTEDEFLAVVKEIVDAHPTTENGDKVHGVATFSDGTLWGWWVMGAHVGQHNVTDIYMWDYLDQKIVNNITDLDSALWNAIRYAYKANQLGIFDPDSLTMTGSDLKAKVTNGQIVSPCCTWYSGSLYSNALAEDPESVSGYMVIPMEGVSHWMGHGSPAGWSFYIGCNADSPYIEKVLQVFDYLNTEEGARMCAMGKEGRAWEYVDGVPTITEEYFDIYMNGTAEEKAVKTNSLNGQFYGISETATLSDGGLACLWKGAQVLKETLNPMEQDYADHYGVDYPAQIAEQMVEEGKAYDQRNVGAVVASLTETPDDITRIDSRLLEIAISYIPELVLAADDAEFEEIQQEFLAEADAAGVQTSIEWWESQVEMVKASLE